MSDDGALRLHINLRLLRFLFIQGVPVHAGGG